MAVVEASNPRTDRLEGQSLGEIRVRTLVRDFVTIDDVEHPFRTHLDFGALEQQEFEHTSSRYDVLYSKDEPLTKAEEKRMERLLDWLFEHVLVNPAAVREQLGDALTGGIKRSVVLTFTNAPLLKAAMAQQTTPEARDSESI